MNYTGTFIGSNGSLGFKNGQEYTFTFRGNILFCLSEPSMCPYESIGAFLRNWENIHILSSSIKNPKRPDTATKYDEEKRALAFPTVKPKKEKDLWDIWFMLQVIAGFLLLILLTLIIQL